MAQDRTTALNGFEGDPAIQLALAYARASDRPLFEALFALDRRLADAVRQASEPIIAQMKLAWWRDRFAQDRAEWPKGEPLLERLAGWSADVSRLGPLVDGWEALLQEGPLNDEAIAAFGEGHAMAWSVAAKAVGQGEGSPRCVALLWAYADLAAHCSSPEDAQRVREVARKEGLLDQAPPHLPRPLRTLGVMGALARRSLRSGRPILSGGGDFLAGVRTGMLGR
ncbi:hypothetical protein [Citromicrobium bathyomarinum]|uniref:hypothetical protein n=1 Tax=Citromicrobium bathyomarinum TaxID=72174 RepID=UPI00315A02AF